MLMHALQFDYLFDTSCRQKPRKLSLTHYHVTQRHWHAANLQ